MAFPPSVSRNSSVSSVQTFATAEGERGPDAPLSRNPSAPALQAPPGLQAREGGAAREESAAARALATPPAIFDAATAGAEPHVHARAIAAPGRGGPSVAGHGPSDSGLLERGDLPAATAPGRRRRLLRRPGGNRQRRRRKRYRVHPRQPARGFQLRRSGPAAAPAGSASGTAPGRGRHFRLSGRPLGPLAARTAAARFERLLHCHGQQQALHPEARSDQHGIDPPRGTRQRRDERHGGLVPRPARRHRSRRIRRARRRGPPRGAKPPRRWAAPSASAPPRISRPMPRPGCCRRPPWQRSSGRAAGTPPGSPSPPCPASSAALPAPC